MQEPIKRTPSLSWRGGVLKRDARDIPEEVPVALVYDASSYAVMMASPTDLQDFAVGFSLTEGIIDDVAQIENLEIEPHPIGIELRMWLAGDRAQRLAARRRFMTGPTGCGLCGVDSLAEAMRPLSKVSLGGRFSPQDIQTALAALRAAQMMNRQTHAVHGAGLWTAESGLLAVREDVGRHNALDKLVGFVKRQNLNVEAGLLLLTSRVSIEMVQKASILGTPVLVAISAPTALAVRMAEEAGLTLVAIARDDGFEIFTHSHRICEGPVAHVA